MPINTQLLIAAPMLQDYLVDKDSGLPLANGVVTLYQDNSRTTFKNWYYQSGSPGAYTYITLPNPLTLSAVGTITDVNGNDTIPFYYPYSEIDNVTPQPYYITVDDSDGERQFTRQNFPFVASGTPQPTENPTFDNLITNNVFWRNISSVNATTLTNIPQPGLLGTTLAPSQHDGFSMPDIQFIKDANGAVDTITFKNFVIGTGSSPDQVIPNDITPEYYMNINCSGAGSETQKYIQIPIQLHVTALSGVVNCSAVIDAQNVSGNVNNQITLGIYQFLGTGVVSPAVIILNTITLSNSWNKYVINFTMPNAQGLTLGGGGDDALYLQIGLPVAETCNINIAKPAIYLSNDVPTNDFQTYDEANSVFSSPRTGDFRISLNSFQPYGWVPLNNLTIGNASSNATNRANIDTWQLFNLIWSQMSVYSNGTSNQLAQMYSSAGSPVAYGASAINDFNANNRLMLTQALGYVIAGAAPATTHTTITANGTATLTMGGVQPYLIYSGMAIAFTNSGGALPAPLVANNIYYVIFTSSTTIQVASTYANAIIGVNIGNIAAGSGTNTVTFSPTGSFIGQAFHTLSIGEMPAHTHPGSFIGSSTSTVVGSFVVRSDTDNANLPVTVASQGGGEAHNNIPPQVFYNMFMKL